MVWDKTLRSLWQCFDLLAVSGKGESKGESCLQTEPGFLLEAVKAEMGMFLSAARNTFPQEDLTVETAEEAEM